MPAAPKAIISDATLRRLKEPAKGRDTYRDGEVRSLYLDLHASGTRSWYLMAKWPAKGGKVRRFKPRNAHESANGHLPLAAVRRLARDWKAMIRANVDPEALLLETEESSRATFAVARERFLEEYVTSLRPKTQAEYQSALRSERFEVWKSLRLEEITKARVVRVLDHVALVDGHPTMANRLRAYLGKFFRWCASKSMFPDNMMLPTERVARYPAGEVVRDRILSQGELRLLLQATGELGYPFGPLIQLLLATGQRLGECATLQWCDVEQAGWLQTDNKSGRKHLVPLSPFATDVLSAIPDIAMARSWVFSTTGRSPVSGFSKFKRRLDKRLLQLAREHREDEAFVTPWRIHDIRRTVATRLREKGVTREVVGLVLNHAPDSITARHYDHHAGLEEKDRALRSWGEELCSLARSTAAREAPATGDSGA